MDEMRGLYGTTKPTRKRQENVDQPIEVALAQLAEEAAKPVKLTGTTVSAAGVAGSLVADTQTR